MFEKYSKKNKTNTDVQSTAATTTSSFAASDTKATTLCSIRNFNQHDHVVGTATIAEHTVAAKPFPAIDASGSWRSTRRRRSSSSSSTFYRFIAVVDAATEATNGITDRRVCSVIATGTCLWGKNLGFFLKMAKKFRDGGAGAQHFRRIFFL